VLAGPGVLGVIPTPEEVDLLAEIGIALLLFTVGLEFPLAELRRLWRNAAGTGALQVGGTAVAAGAVAMAAGVELRAAVFAGLFVALSSTAIVLKELGRRNWLDSPAGRLSTGVLLFQDLCVVVLLLAAPLLAGAADAATIPLVLGQAALALVGVVLVGRFVLPVLFNLVAATGQREAFSIAVLVASVGTAALSAGLGLSAALGAFLAGLMLGGSEFSHQAHAEIRPLRDLLASLFFISLGMLVEPASVLASLPIILLVALGMVVLKAVLAGGAVALSGGPVRAAVATSLFLAQVGEFSFILGRDALALGVLPQGVWDVLLPASILTMVVTPAVLGAAPRVADWVTSRWKLPADVAAEAAAESQVVILGFGVGGRLMAAALHEFGVPYHVLDTNGATVRAARADGEPVTFGDATSPDTLEALGIARARAVVVVLSDPDAALKVVRTIRRVAPGVPVFVRARYRLEAEHLRAAGAIAVAEELEASLEVLAQLLARLSMPGNVIEALLDGYRHREGLRRATGAPQVALESLAGNLMAAPVASHQVEAGHWADGRTLADLHLRSETGASVLAVRRGDRFFTSPPADFEIRAGDLLLLVGSEAQVRAGRARLTTVPPGRT
jgi:CPA2 family monovalent cation:H+ antiporter-2